MPKDSYSTVLHPIPYFCSQQVTGQRKTQWNHHAYVPQNKGAEYQINLIHCLLSGIFDHLSMFSHLFFYDTKGWDEQGLGQPRVKRHACP